ncbi:hypothetical protein FD724_37315 (plasmid) [Nostoc sp. C057]|uniref:hypothetical protein n=1 Tax=Nostoc sp. C057 TaxID=2576903 RepID=UPI0015C399EF|nr:hypothetical protein [Nostoc sp. C057]QLE53541.1 hypothetical protein FD724_37315 [Nostoc sp. C057]
MVTKVTSYLDLIFAIAPCLPDLTKPHCSREETVRNERINLPPPLFVAWCKNKDRAGLGWEFNQNTGLYQPVS